MRSSVSVAHQTLTLYEGVRIPSPQPKHKNAAYAAREKIDEIFLGFYFFIKDYFSHYIFEKLLKRSVIT